MFGVKGGGAGGGKAQLVPQERINLHLTGDYKFGNTDWYQFFQGSTSAVINPNMSLGHIELSPAPEPSRALLACAGLMTLLLRRKRVA